MNLIVSDNVIDNPVKYLSDILSNEFIDVFDGVNTFHNIQPRPHDDEFAKIALESVGLGYEVAFNFIRKSPEGQEEPNFIHTDEMMGDVTAILYLSRSHPIEDGTTIYEEGSRPSCVVYSKFNRMLMFDSKLPHSRNIFENFGVGDLSRIIQVTFLREKK